VGNTLITNGQLSSHSSVSYITYVPPTSYAWYTVMVNVDLPKYRYVSIQRMGSQELLEVMEMEVYGYL